MKLIPGIALASATALLCTAGAVAQEKPMEKAKPGEMKMEVPKPGPEMEKIKWLIGSWTVLEKHEPSEWGPGGEGKGTIVSKLGPGGFSIISDYKSTGPMGSFTGHGIMAWDPEAKVYKSAWSDGMAPGIAMADCQWEGADLVCTGDSTFMGKKMSNRMRMTDITPTSGSEVFETSVDGGPFKKMMTLRYTKVK